jgi:hypothetical protein
MRKRKLIMKEPDQDKLDQDKDQDKELLGSDAYLSGYKLDTVDRELRRKIKENEYENDARKRALILNAAERYTKAGYPERMICKRICDLLSNKEYNTSGSYVRKILPEKYKDLDQMNTAKMKNFQEGANRLSQQERVARKEIKDIVEQDFKYIKMNKAKAAFVFQRKKAEWFAQQVKQLESKLEIK